MYAYIFMWIKGWRAKYEYKISLRRVIEHGKLVFKILKLRNYLFGYKFIYYVCFALRIDRGSLYTLKFVCLTFKARPSCCSNNNYRGCGSRKSRTTVCDTEKYKIKNVVVAMVVGLV